MLEGLGLAGISGVCNGLFSAPMKLIRQWRWENIWLVFIVVACILMPLALTLPSGASLISTTLSRSPATALWAACTFGFAWGFGAILFGLSVDRLGVSLANSLVIGLSSALGSIIPLLITTGLHANRKTIVLILGVLTFLIGVAFCGSAGVRRTGVAGSATVKAPLSAYLFCIGSGIMSAIFNIGYSIALPIADTGVEAGLSQFSATNVIWLLMLGAGSLPNMAYCGWLMSRNGSARLFTAPDARGWLLAPIMGLLWGGSIFLYGAATPKLGSYGPSIGWPLSLAVGLLVANLMGVLLGEWRGQPRSAVNLMWTGIATLLIAIGLCAWSASIGSA
jgi:L-rhamnose-H+ transport protein